MFFRRRHRDIPELNTTSTADISFMLLVFFLVTSSMDTDRGLARRLPPADEQHDAQQDISRSNVLQVRISADDALYCDGRPVTTAELQAQVESFVASRQTDRHVIAVEADRHASYDAYFNMQNAVVAAYHALRQNMARQRYGHSFDVCTREEREAIMARYPQRISEAIVATAPAEAGSGPSATGSGQPAAQSRKGGRP